MLGPRVMEYIHSVGAGGMSEESKIGLREGPEELKSPHTAEKLTGFVDTGCSRHFR